MKDTAKKIGKSILLLPVGALLGTLLLLLAYCLPVNGARAEESLQIKVYEGEYPSANILHNNAGQNFGAYKPETLDDATDYEILRRVYYDCGSDKLYQAMDMQEYARYWHGYVVLLRPVLNCLNYFDFRTLNCLAQMALIMAAVCIVWREFGRKRYVLALLTSYILLAPLALFFSLQYFWIFYISYGMICLVICKKEYLLQKQRYFYLFQCIGMLTVYFDLLTFPLLTWGFPLLWWIAACGDRLSGKERMKKAVLSGFAWVFGYGGMWGAKWVIASPVLGYNVVEQAVSQIFLRTGDVDNIVQDLMGTYRRIEVFYTNWRHYEYGIYMVILVLWMLWAIYRSVGCGFRKETAGSAYLLIALVSQVWYFALSNHTIIHHFFTYRIYGVGILGLLLYLCEAFPEEQEKSTISRKKRMGIVAGWIVCFLIGWCVSSLETENVTSIYGTEYDEIPAQEGDVLTCEFYHMTPLTIRNIGFCVLPENEQVTGQIEVSFVCNGEVLHTVQRDLDEGTYYTMGVDWKLESQKEYEMQVRLKNLTGKVSFLVTREGNLPLTEFRSMKINGEEIQNRQPLGGVIYHTMVESKTRRGYAALMCSVFLMALLWELRFVGSKLHIGKNKAAMVKGVGCLLLIGILLCTTGGTAQAASPEIVELYRSYTEKFEKIESIDDLQQQNYRILEGQVFPVLLEGFGEEEVWFYAALDNRYHRLAVFIADAESRILYKTDRLEANYCYPGELRQPVKKLASVSFQDVDNDGDTDIILIAQCHNDRGEYQKESYKVGDVLFQKDGSFYRDYRISDKINRFDMNKNPGCILNFVRDGRSTEFLYTAETLADLLNHNFNVIEEQSYTRNFEKLGRLKVVPGTYRMSEYDVFMIYLIDEQGNIVWSFQPMEDYDNLYALKGIQGKDLDGDGLKDLVVFAKYSYEGENGELLVDTVCTVYYQRTAGFEKDVDFTENYECTEEDTLEALVTKIRAYWGWQT